RDAERKVLLVGSEETGAHQRDCHLGPFSAIAIDFDSYIALHDLAGQRHLTVMSTTAIRPLGSHDLHRGGRHVSAFDPATIENEGEGARRPARRPSRRR